MQLLLWRFVIRVINFSAWNFLNNTLVKALVRKFPPPRPNVIYENMYSFKVLEHFSFEKLSVRRKNGLLTVECYISSVRVALRHPLSIGPAKLQFVTFAGGRIIQFISSDNYLELVLVFYHRNKLDDFTHCTSRPWWVASGSYLQNKNQFLIGLQKFDFKFDGN